jgi:uncharacterized protein YndB with AHSA1/START domain
MRAEASIIINKPIETVFTFTSDHETVTKWSIFKEVKMLSDGPVGVGWSKNFYSTIVWCPCYQCLSPYP